MKRSFSILPGFRLASGITLFYLSLLVLIPLCALVWKTTELSLDELVATLTNSRVLASFRVSILTALAAATINLVLGFVIAWVLVRYPMPMKRLFDAVIDLRVMESVVVWLTGQPFQGIAGRFQIAPTIHRPALSGHRLVCHRGRPLERRCTSSACWHCPPG